jgi:hypothetical protein
MDFVTQPFGRCIAYRRKETDEKFAKPVLCQPRTEGVSQEIKRDRGAFLLSVSILTIDDSRLVRM